MKIGGSKMESNAFSIEQLYCYGTKLLIKKGEYIYNPNNALDGQCAFFLDSGLCALTSLTKSGEEKIFLYFRGKRTVGFSQLMPIIEHSFETKVDFYIVAKTDCTVYRITKEIFYMLLNQDPHFNYFMIKVLSENYLEVLYRFHQYQDESAMMRLCRLLLEQSYEKGGKLIFPSYFTYSELSKYLGNHSVTIARIMEKLKQYGYISKQGRNIIVNDPKQLKLLIDNESNIDY